MGWLGIEYSVNAFRAGQLGLTIIFASVGHTVSRPLCSSKRLQHTILPVDSFDSYALTAC